MYRIIDGRGTGKTSRLLLIAKENNAVVACENPAAMREKAHAYGLTCIDFISYYDLLVNGNSYNQVVIDEIEYFVRFVITNTGTLIGYTLSDDD